MQHTACALPLRSHGRVAHPRRRSHGGSYRGLLWAADGATGGGSGSTGGGGASTKEVGDLRREVARLEEENNMLQYKMEVLIDMVSLRYRQYACDRYSTCGSTRG